MMLLVVPILPVQLIALDLVRSGRLNGVVVESNQVELRLIALIGRLRLGLRWPRVLLRILLLVLRLLRRRSSLPLTLRRWRVALLIPVILLRSGRCRIAAAVVSIRIVPVSIGIIPVRVTWVAVIVRVAAAKSEIEARPVVRSIPAVVAIAAYRSTPESTNAAAAESADATTAESTADAAAMSPGESTAACSASAGVSTAAGMSAATMLSIGCSDQTREAQSSEERDFRKSHIFTAFYFVRCGGSRLGSSLSQL